MAEYTLTILGSNSAVPAHDRYPTAQFLKHKQSSFLIDCGEGTQFQLNKYHIKRGNLNHIFISHMHGDHYFGLVGLLNSFKLNNRQHELHIYGPPELDAIIRLQADYTDAQWPYPIFFHPHSFEGVDVLMENDSIRVHSIPLKHKIPCNGFLFREKPKLRKIVASSMEKYGVHHEEILAIKKGGDFVAASGEVIANALLTEDSSPSYSYAYCSDTMYDEELVQYVQGVDVLYHEATFKSDSEDKALLRFHSTARQAALIAKAANVGQLIIGHYSAKYKNLDELLTEAREIFPNTELALEGKVFDIPAC